MAQPHTSAQPSRPGLYVREDGVVTFALFAPGKERIDLIGDFNGWEPGVDRFEARPEGLWFVEKHLDPGTYRYQFVVDDVVICDPYARAIDAATKTPKAVLELGKRPFRWRNESWTRPPFSDLIIYELHIGDFSPEGTFDGAIRRLDHLENLGVTAIELLPVTQAAPTDYWGYEPAYFFAVENDYGNADDLRRLIDEAHGRGLAVILDIVLAHTAHEHPFAKLYPIPLSPWYGQGIGGDNEFGFPTFDHRKPAARAFTRDVQDYWLREFRADGLRYDYIKNVGYRPGEGTECLVEDIRQLFPDAYLIGEHLAEEPDKSTTVDFDGVWHARFSRGIKALLGEREVDKFEWDEFTAPARTLDASAEGYPCPGFMVNYIVSHDEDRLARELKGWGFSEERVPKKLALGATVLLTAGGEPMFLEGDEWGEDDEHTLRANPIHWEKLETDDGRALFEHYRQLCVLRREHEALRSDNFRLLAADPDTKTLVFRRWTDAGENIVVAANFSGQAQTVSVIFPKEGRWRDLLTGHEIDVTGATDLPLDTDAAAVLKHG